MAAAMSEDGATQYCKNCKGDIPQQSFQLHEVHCYRKIKLCRKCEEPVFIENMEEHIASHEPVQCVCKMPVEKLQLETHQKEECSHRLMQCNFCELSLKAMELNEHEKACGSRTEKCEKCNKFVMIRDAETHDCTLVNPPINNDGINYLKNQPVFGASSSSMGNFSPFLNGYDVDNDMNIYGSQGRNKKDVLGSTNLQSNGRCNGVSVDITPLDIDDEPSKYSTSSATSSGGTPPRQGASRSIHQRHRKIVRKNHNNGVDNSVLKDLQGLEIANVEHNKANATSSSNYRQKATERNVSRNSSKLNSTRQPRTARKQIGRAEVIANLGIQGRPLQSELLLRGSSSSSGILDSDVVADGRMVRGRHRNEGHGTVKSRRTEGMKKETHTLIKDSDESRDIPILVEDEGDMFSSRSVYSDGDLELIGEGRKPIGHGNNAEEDSIQIPCEICKILVNVEALQAHQEQCLLEQQQALQTFSNQMPGNGREMVEEIVIDDKPDDINVKPVNNEETFIPCEFCEEAFPMDSIILHQPYCDMNPQRHFTEENMDVPIEDNSLPTSTRSRDFWGSRVYERTDFQQRPPFFADSNINFNTSIVDEMRNNSSDPEDETRAFRSGQRHWP